MSVSDLYIPRIGPHISCSRIGTLIVGFINRLQTHEFGNWDVDAQFLFFEFSVLFLCSVVAIVALSDEGFGKVW